MLGTYLCLSAHRACDATRVFVLWRNHPKVQSFLPECVKNVIMQGSTKALNNWSTWDDMGDVKFFLHVEKLPWIINPPVPSTFPSLGTGNAESVPMSSCSIFLQACATAAMHPAYYVHQDEDIVDVWKPCRGWWRHITASDDRDPLNSLPWIMEFCFRQIFPQVIMISSLQN